MKTSVHYDGRYGSGEVKSSNYRSPRPKRCVLAKPFDNWSPKRGGANDHVVVQVFEEPPVPDVIRDQTLMMTQVRNDGAIYYQAKKNLDGLLRLKREQMPDGGEKLSEGIARDEERLGLLARYLFESVEMLVRHEVMMKLGERGLLVDVPTRLRWHEINFTPYHAHGIVGKHGQCIATEKASLVAARIDVIRIFRLNLDEFPDLQTHLAM